MCGMRAVAKKGMIKTAPVMVMGIEITETMDIAIKVINLAHHMGLTTTKIFF